MATVKTTTGEEVAKIAEEIYQKLKGKGGIKRVYCLACGGSKASCYLLENFLQTESKTIFAQSYSANEFVYDTPKGLDGQSVAFAMSMGGSTKETMDAARVAKEHGATVVTLSITPDAAIAKIGDHHVVYSDESTLGFEAINQALLLRFGFELLRLQEGYEFYDQAVDGYKKLPGLCERVVKLVAARAKRFGVEHKDEPVIYTMTSGPASYAAYMECICMFMEMEWVHSSSIHSGEFFHGPFEVTDQDTPFVMMLGDGPTRPLDERALKFLQRYGKKITVIDAKELGVNTMDGHVTGYYGAILIWIAALEYAKGLAEAKEHPLFMRRYMGKVEY